MGGEHGALPIVRTLARHGLRSIVVSEDPDDITFHSRFCVCKVVLEPFGPESDEVNVSRLIMLARSLGQAPVLFWGSDREALFLSRNRRVLQRSFRFYLSERSLIEDLTNKVRFARLSCAHKLPVPETFVFCSREDIAQAADSIPFPCTVKPDLAEEWSSPYLKAQFGSYKHVLRRLETKSELLAHLQLLPHIENGIVLQRFVRGGDDQIFSFHGYFDDTGTFRAGFVGRKIRTNPIEFGGSAYVETVTMPDLIALSADICGRLGYKGIVKIDYKREAETQKWYLLEFNPRFTLWEQVGAWAGLNIPALWYDDLGGKPSPPATRYRPGVRWLCVAQDLRSFPAYYRSGQWGIWEWLRSYHAPKVFHTFSWNDPWPIMFSFPRFLGRKIARWKIRHRIRGI